MTSYATPNVSLDASRSRFAYDSPTGTSGGLSKTMRQPGARAGSHAQASRTATERDVSVSIPIQQSAHP